MKPAESFWPLNTRSFSVPALVVSLGVLFTATYAQPSPIQRVEALNKTMSTQSRISPEQMHEFESEGLQWVNVHSDSNQVMLWNGLHVLCADCRFTALPANLVAQASEGQNISEPIRGNLVSTAAGQRLSGS